MNQANVATQDTSAPDLRAPRNRWASLALLAVVQLMVVLDVSITNVALPTIASDLTMDQQALSWVVNAYALVFGGLLILGGRMGDLLGRRKMFAAGLGVFTLGSLLGGLSDSGTQIIAARAIQGLGGALLAPAVLSITATLFAEGAERNKAMGILGAIAGSGGAIGVLLGGVLTDNVGWEWVFFVNVPIGVAALVATPLMLDESTDEHLDRHFDLPGALLVTSGMVTLVYALVDANDAGWSSLQTIGLLAASAVLLTLFVFVEQRSRQPLVRLGILRIRTVLGANVVSIAIAAAMFAMFYFLTFYVQNVLGLTPLETGVRYLPLALSIIVTAGLASVLTTRFGVRRVMIFGLVVMGIGLGWMTNVEVDSTWQGTLLGPMLVAGFGMGFVFVPMMIAAVAGVAKEEHGLASGLINTTQQIGGAVGFAVLFAVFDNAREDAFQDAAAAAAAGGGPAAAGTPDPELARLALTEGIQAAFIGAVLLAAAAVILAVWLVRPNPADERAALEAQSTS